MDGNPGGGDLLRTQAKIFSKHLDKIISGEKMFDFRQMEDITFTDENGRSVTMEIKEIDLDFEEVARELYPDVPWEDDLPIYIFRLGRRLT